MTHHQEQLLCSNLTGITVGDFVQVLRDPKHEEEPWDEGYVTGLKFADNYSSIVISLNSGPDHIVPVDKCRLPGISRPCDRQLDYVLMPSAYTNQMD